MLPFLKKLFGTKSEKDIKSIQPILDKVIAVYPKFQHLTNDQLREKTQELKSKIQNHISQHKKEIDDILTQINTNPDLHVDDKEKLYKDIDVIENTITKKLEDVLLEILPEAFAILKDTARRFTEYNTIAVTANTFDKQLATSNKNIELQGNQVIWHNSWLAAGNEVKWNMIHYDTQLIGGIILHQGKIAEMATGEGKTLVSTLPVFLNALSGRGVHVVTVNNYLAKRDSEWNAPLFQFHGLSVDCIDKHEPHTPERRAAYLADITYGTNNEFGFDYLRDNMSRDHEDLVQRKHNFAIVDEVDSVLIDDARTPLIISGPIPKGDVHEFNAFKPRVDKVVQLQKTLVLQYINQAKQLFTEGKEKEAGIPLLKAHRGLPKHSALIKFLSEPGVKTLLQTTENYHLQDQQKEMPNIDKDLYFVIEEKMNSVDLTEKGIDLITANTDDKNFFIIPNVGAEIANLELQTNLTPQEKQTQRDQLLQEFSIKNERIHTVQQLLKAYTLFEIDQEYVIVDGQIKIVDEQTGRIMEGRRYSDGLHQALEAKENVKIEAATQTYATITLQNYFRMYNKLAGMTGTAETEANEFWDIYKLDVVVIPTNRQIIRKDLNDLVYKTKREKYNAVIDQIVEFVNQKRPVLVGTTSVEISELLSRMLKLRNIKHNVLNAKLHQKEADIVAEAGIAGTVTIATNMAGRGTDIKLGTGVKDAGGLAIIGTERHESRRVDRQLRGRAGRQGDPGSSLFYVSLEDNLMRLFGSDRIASLMDRMGLKEGEVIQHTMISKSIERAQKKIEENHFGTRKRLIEYDDVMNAQRDVIYKRRKNALYGDRLSVDIANMIFEVVDAIVSDNHSSKNYQQFQVDCLTCLGFESPYSETEFINGNENDLTNKLFVTAEQHYQNKVKQLAATTIPVIRDILNNPNNAFENMVTEITNGINTIQVLTNIRNTYDSKGMELIKEFEKTVVLSVIDDAWKEHLREMDDLKQSVHNAALEQKDPLVIYKLESFNLFKNTITKTSKGIISFLMTGGVKTNNNAQAPLRFTQQSKIKKTKEKLVEAHSDFNDDSSDEQKKPKAIPVKAEVKIGRNDPCICGSGKKYKACHGANV